MTDWELKPHGSIPRGLPVLVCILDGWGENVVKDQWNATHAAATPTVDALRAVGPSRWRTVKAHGPAVGLPTWDDMGNSEVGHNALGAGQLIDQGARLVDRALKEGTLFQQDGWKYISNSFAANTVHFIGLLSSGGVHSRANQLYERACPRAAACGVRSAARHVACVRLARANGEKRLPLQGRCSDARPAARAQYFAAASAAARSASASTFCWMGATCPTARLSQTRQSWRRHVQALGSCAAFARSLTRS